MRASQIRACQMSVAAGRRLRAHRKYHQDENTVKSSCSSSRQRKWRYFRLPLKKPGLECAGGGDPGKPGGRRRAGRGEPGMPGGVLAGDGPGAGRGEPGMPGGVLTGEGPVAGRGRGPGQGEAALNGRRWAWRWLGTGRAWFGQGSVGCCHINGPFLPGLPLEHGEN